MIWEHILDKLQDAVAPTYEVQRLLGYGGMAGVYLAFQPSLGRYVAIKVMSPMLMADPQMVARFQQEARTIAQLRHGHIVGIHEVRSESDLHFFTMEYVPGRTLGTVLKQTEEPLPVDVLRVWLNQIGSALDYAHRRGVVHRDIKPSNVLLDSDGQAHVTDFGIAKVADQVGLTQTGAWVGTPTYMSPEQCSGGEISGSSDQYSLGCVMYELVTGSPPFEGNTVGMIQAHVSRKPPPISSARVDVPEDLTTAIDRMLEKRPEERWPTLAHMVASLSPADPTDDGLHSRLVAFSGTVTGLQIQPELDTLTTGQSLSVSPVIQANDGVSRTGRRRVQWESTDPGVVAVSAAGELTGVSVGSAEVRASFGGQVATLRIRVMPDASGDGLRVSASDKASAAVGLGEPIEALFASAPANAGYVTRPPAPDATAVTDEPAPPAGERGRRNLLLSVFGAAVVLLVAVTGFRAFGGSQVPAEMSPTQDIPGDDWGEGMENPFFWEEAPEPTPPAPTAETPPTVSPLVRAELDELLVAFAEAIEGRDPADLAVDFLGGSSGTFLNEWAPLIADRQGYRELEVASIEFSTLTATPVRAAGIVRLVLTYEDRTGTPRQYAVRADAEFRWSDDAWRFSRLQEIERSES